MGRELHTGTRVKIDLWVGSTIGGTGHREDSIGRHQTRTRGRLRMHLHRSRIAIDHRYPNLTDHRQAMLSRRQNQLKGQSGITKFMIRATRCGLKSRSKEIQSISYRMSLRPQRLEAGGNTTLRGATIMISRAGIVQKKTCQIYSLMVV